MSVQAVPFNHNLPVLTAEGLLWALAQDARAYIDKTGVTYAFANAFIEKMGGTVFAEIQINEKTFDIDYLVGVFEEGETYPKLTYSQAVRQLRALLDSEVVF